MRYSKTLGYTDDTGTPYNVTGQKLAAMGVREEFLNYPRMVKALAFAMLFVTPFWIVAVTLWEARNELKTTYKGLFDVMKA